VGESGVAVIEFGITAAELIDVKTQVVISATKIIAVISANFGLGLFVFIDFPLFLVHLPIVAKNF
jgi:hypothetical protein